MPFQRTDHPGFWYIDKRLTCGLRTGRLATRTKSERTARAMEHLLETLSERAIITPAWMALLEAVRDKRVTLIELMQSHQAGRLDELLRRLDDPPLQDAVRAYLHTGQFTRQGENGLHTLLRLVPVDARLSYLADGKRITELCLTREREGVMRNSVRRQLLRSISKLLRHTYGNAERNRIFSDVQFPAQDDRRHVNLSPAEIARLLSTAAHVGGPELVALIRLAMQTSADRGVLLEGQGADRYFEGLRVRDVAIFRETDGRYTGEVHYADRKARGRRRTVGLTQTLCELLIPLCESKGPDAPVFSISYTGLDYLWSQVRTQAALPGLRFKDLRHQFFQYGTKAGLPLAVLSRGGGHTQIGRTASYSDYKATFDGEHAAAVEREMGLTG